MNKILKLISAILICQFAGVIGSFFTAPAIASWYSTLAKPEFNPPNYLFAPVWILLFTLMGISLFLVWEKGFSKKESKIALSFFSIQLALNSIWSFLFFGLKNPFYALIEIIFLWFAILATIYYFSKISKKAALLLLPYIAWVSFAAVLNFFIFSLN